MTEAELLGADDVLPQLLWARYFIRVQGYYIDEIIMHQDNMSAMLLENNKRKRINKNTKHHQVRYSMITDRIAMNELSVKLYGT